MWQEDEFSLDVLKLRLPQKLKINGRKKTQRVILLNTHTYTWQEGPRQAWSGEAGGLDTILWEKAACAE